MSNGVRLGHGQFYGAFERRCAAGLFAFVEIAVASDSLPLAVRHRGEHHVERAADIDADDFCLSPEAVEAAIKLLLKAGVDANSATNLGETALMTVARAGGGKR